MNWTKIDLLPLPQDGTEFLVRDGNQGGVKSLVYWNIIHNHWESKGTPVSLHDTHWLEIPEFMPDCTYDCDKCGKSFIDVLYHNEPQSSLCPECKENELHRKLLDLMQEARFAYSRYEASAEQHDLDEMNEKQLEIISMFDKRQSEVENLKGQKDLTPTIVKELKKLVNTSGFAIPTSVISKIIEENEDLKTHSATSDFCSAEWKNDFDNVQTVIQKIDDATTSDDNLMEKVLVIKNIIEDYNQENK